MLTVSYPVGEWKWWQFVNLWWIYEESTFKVRATSATLTKFLQNEPMAHTGSRKKKRLKVMNFWTQKHSLFLALSTIHWLSGLMNCVATERSWSTGHFPTRLRGGLLAQDRLLHGVLASGPTHPPARRVPSASHSSMADPKRSLSQIRTSTTTKLARCKKLGHEALERTAWEMDELQAKCQHTPWKLQECLSPCPMTTSAP